MAVCGVGQGTSLLLKMNIEEELKKLGFEADVDNTSISMVVSETPDYIVTNSEFAKQLVNHPSQIIIVENYFDNNEIAVALEKIFK
ncbi:ascorbate-specific phosphotransferase enzyme IIB component [Spiroplasma clarkii]|uniref:PTS sugar transporter subunit IIB n=1 Tax=Spiroplasma clarkii TaxID=2139 RepID=UPI000B54CD4B|nr:PTS sugar transporter subunit IIB [Spiroplasma clarkii]ARU91851.1 ascorbate-specific phosphotransferase enzyme IIB component [Spiroplasma clarkii]